MNDSKRGIAAAEGMAISGTDIARACAEVILEHAPEGDRMMIDKLKASILEFCASPANDMKPDTLAVATITKTIGSVVDTSNIRDINISALQREGRNEA